MFLYDTHVHTSEISPCGQGSAAQQVRAAKKLGYTGIIITDHLVQHYGNCPDDLPWPERAHFQKTSYMAAKEEGDRIGIDVFFGWEYTHWHNIPGVDILTYGLDVDFLLAHPKLFTYNIQEYSAAVREAGGYLAQAHPYRPDRNRAFDIKGFNPTLFDGAEIFNASEPKENNANALAYANEFNLHKQSGSDSHALGRKLKGGVWLEKRAKSIHDIIAAIKNNAKLDT